MLIDVYVRKLFYVQRSRSWFTLRYWFTLGGWYSLKRWFMFNSWDVDFRWDADLRWNVDLRWCVELRWDVDFRWNWFTLRCWFTLKLIYVEAVVFDYKSRTENNTCWISNKSHLVTTLNHNWECFTLVVYASFWKELCFHKCIRKNRKRGLFQLTWSLVTFME